MEEFSVAAAVRVSAKRTRQQHEPDTIAEAVTEARQIGPQAAAHKVNKKRDSSAQIPEDTVGTWLKRWKKEGKFWEKETKRGRHSMVSSVPGVMDEWSRQVDSLRKQGAAVTARVSATVVRAVLEEKSPSLLHTHGGAAKVSVRSGGNLLAANDMSYRKRTSSRIIPPVDVMENARDSFYQDLRDCWPGCDVDHSLVINFDQTFQLFHPDRGYTWEKKGSTRVQLIQHREGFTLLPVVSAAGIVGAQLIFDGSTPLSLPTVASGSLLHFLQTANHWSDESTTIKLWKGIILPHIAARRTALGQPRAPAIVLADAFGAHWTKAVKDLVSKEDCISYICVPDSLTHVFQPLDLGIIAALKQSVLRRQDEFRANEIRVAIRENRGVVLSKSKPVLRNRVTMYIKEALEDPNICAASCCWSGFARAGVTRVLYNDQDVVPDVDETVPLRTCDDCGESARFLCDTPTCSCFEEDARPVLCEGCFYNHCNLCLQV